MITTIQQLDKNRILIRCHYANGRDCRSITGCSRFDYDLKGYVVPITSLPEVKEVFRGKAYYKTPLWKLEGKSEPDKEPLRLFGPMQDIPELALKPYRYQEDGIRFMIDRLNNKGFCLNGDGVGLGKTLQSVGTIKWFVENRGARKMLVVCKKSLKEQWADEIRRIAGWNEDCMPIFITGGTTKKRKQAPYSGIQEASRGILITNYEDFQNWKEEIDKVNYDLCVIDEAHCIKGRDGVKNNLISDTCCGKRTILLTGTPIMSRPDDIWGIVRLASKKPFGDDYKEYKDFKNRFIVEEFNRKFLCREITGAQNLDELQELMSEFLIMRSAEDAAIDLPVQREPRKISCPMDSVQLKMQAVIDARRSMQEKRKKELVEKHGLSASARAEIDAINEQGKMYLASLQYIASDPAVLRTKFRGVDPADERLKRNVNWQLYRMLPESYTMSPKTEVTLDIVSELVDADEKVIIFCYFASTARMLYDLLGKIRGANPRLFVGRTPDAERAEIVRAFRNDPECRVLIGNDAMTEGLNLQSSRHLIHFEQAETNAKKEQRNGRIRRIGSKYKYINIIDVCTADSMDEIKIKKLNNDRSMTEGTLSGTGNKGALREARAV